MTFAPKISPTQTHAQQPAVQKQDDQQALQMNENTSGKSGLELMHAKIQAKINMGEPNDKFEKEGDNNAAQVMSKSASVEATTDEESTKTLLQTSLIDEQGIPYHNSFEKKTKISDESSGDDFRLSTNNGKDNYEETAKRSEPQVSLGSLKSGFLMGTQFEQMAFYDSYQDVDSDFEFTMDVGTKNSYSPNILNLQMALNYLYSDFAEIDGFERLILEPIYNEETRHAIEYFQINYIAPRERKIRKDGVLDGITIRWLDKAILEKQGTSLGQFSKAISEDLEKEYERGEEGNISFGECQLDSEYWKSVPGEFSTLVMKSTAIPHEAILSVFINNSTIECHTSIYIIWYKTLLDYWGKDIFDEVFKWKSETEPGMAITVNAHGIDIGLLGFISYIDAGVHFPQDLIAGDWLSYKNDERYEKRHPRGPYGNENLIYAGNQKYNGFAMGIGISERQIRQVMISEFLEEPTLEEESRKGFDPDVSVENPEPVGFLPIIRRLNIMEVELVRQSIGK